MFDFFTHRVLRVPYKLHVRQVQIIPNASMTYVFVHGLGDTGELWGRFVKRLPKNINHVVVDLLGFGESPRPSWSAYDAAAQAASLRATFRSLHIDGPVTLVGHSLGALVSVETAMRYKKVAALVLCSPPIYGNATTKNVRRLLSKDTVVRQLYKAALQDPKRVVDAYAIGQRLKLIAPSMSVTDETVQPFITSLHASILNQQTVDTIGKIDCPITILNGTLDPFTITKHLKQLAREYANITLKIIPTGHVINSLYEKAILVALGFGKSPKRPKQ